MGVSLFSIFLFTNCMVVIFCKETNKSCTTPNGEKATCVSYDSCTIIKRAISSGDEKALRFARASECTFDNEPLLCCGSKAFFDRVPQTSVLADKDICGYQITDERVIGGEETEIGEFPWMVLLGYKSTYKSGIEYKCGGTLINNRYVLTAAHCIKIKAALGVTLEVVRLGEWRLSTKDDCSEDLVNDECADPVVDVFIEKQIPHPRYSKKTGNNDIGLLRLEKNIEYTDYIRPICLQSPNASSPEIGSTLMVAGWGTTENGTTADIKMRLMVPVVASAECAEKVKINGEVTDNQLCAGGERKKDSCKGDSGGPLMGMKKGQDSKPQWLQEGIIAWGVGCGRLAYPGVYTRVARYIDWISENLY